jgi:hypothetical protein
MNILVTLIYFILTPRSRSRQLCQLYTDVQISGLISYNLRDDNDITARIAAANASMGALKELWRNPHLDMYNKYLLF